MAECTANGGARPSEVKLAGGARELVRWCGQAAQAAQAAQAEGGYRPNHLPPIRSH